MNQQTKRRLIHGGNSLVIVITVIGIFIALNFLANRYTERFDLTQNSIFSLSDQTEKIVSDLDSDVIIQAFLPEKFRSYEEGKQIEFLKDLLAEYDGISSHIKIEYINPNKEPQKAKEANISFAPALVVKADVLQDVVYGGNIDEQNITSTIVKLTRRTVNKIGVIKNKNGHELTTDMTLLKNALESEGYHVEEIDLMTALDLSSFQAVIVPGVSSLFTDNEMYTIDKYIYEGGKVLFGVDPMKMTGLENLLATYGINVEDDFIVEEKSYYWDLFSGKFYHWPIIVNFGDFQVVKNFKSVMLQLARSISISSDISSDIEVNEFMMTTEGSWAETDLASNSAKFDEGVDLRGPFTVGVSLKGKFKSAYENAQIVSGISSTSQQGLDVNLSQEETTPELERGDNKDARIIVIGDSEFMTDANIRRNNNGDLIMNSINWLLEDEDLISIRPKEAEDRSIKQLTETENTLVFWGNLLGMPIIVLLIGLIRYFWIKKSREK